jgi:hypothetical protein
MSDRVKALTVALEFDLSDENAHKVVEAINQLRFVIGVTKVSVDPGDYVARQRVKHEMQKRFTEWVLFDS